VTSDRQQADAMSEPSAEEIAEALATVVDERGLVPPGVVGPLARARGWSGRLIDVLHVVTDDAETMGYLAGGRRPDEVMTWARIWAESPLSLGEIRMIVSSAGWDPEPFVVLSRAGLLEAVLRCDDGSPRRIDGELAGGWVSDQLAEADEAQVVARVEAVLAASQAPPDAGPAAR
jgi:hypothetical protein